MNDTPKKRFLWMLIDINDKFSLPLYVADSSAKLAEYCGVKPATVCSAVNHLNTDPKRQRCKYVRVEVSEEDWQWCHC